MRENAARQDLLSALGFDDETQQRFIESAAKRHAVYTIIREDHGRTSLSQTPGERHAETPLAAPARVDTEAAKAAAESVDLRSGGVQAMDYLNTSTELTGVATNWQANALDPAVARTRASHMRSSLTHVQMENWLFSPETLDKLPSPLVDLDNDVSWLTEPYNSFANLAPGVVNAVELTDSTPALVPTPESSIDGLSNGLQWTSMTSDNNQSVAGQSIDRCFLDTVVQLQSGETSTACSIALSLIFRYNRKGLPMAELQKMLKPGMRSSSGDSGECRIEDSVLFKVVADIST